MSFDEGSGEDDALSPSLIDRSAFRIDLDSIPGLMDFSDDFTREDMDRARQLMGQVTCDETIREVLVKAALSLGVPSVRADYQALRAARGLAALSGRSEVSDEDAVEAARLVFSWRCMPPIEEEPDQETAQPQEESEPQDSNDPNQDDAEIDPKELEDLIIEAVQSALQANMISLGSLESSKSRRRAAEEGRSGALKKGSERGRQIGIKSAGSRSQNRLDVLETIKASIPWQMVRGNAVQSDGDGAGHSVSLPLAIRAGDFRYKRFKAHTGRVVIFVVDASGSAAMDRLAEAKGAVEILLSECYSRRNQVALIAFRGRSAEVLLAPTSALSRARRCLADLPGGGGTPLASAIETAFATAETVSRKGLSPFFVFMTDGKANIAKDGRADRVRAFEDAKETASLLRLLQSEGVWIDTSRKPDDRVRELAARAGIEYLPLPFAQSRALSEAASHFFKNGH